MTASPIIFCHYGISNYLKFTLFSAKLSNPLKSVILIGDNDNKSIANELGIQHIDFSIYENEASIFQFNKDFKFIAGKSHGRLEWTKFVFKRWFYVNEYVSNNNIDSFWHFDSDNLIVSDLSKKEKYFKKYDNTEQCGGICLNGFISSRRIVNMYVIHILSLFNNQEFLNKQIDKCSKNPNFAFTEMAAYSDFKMKYSLKTIRLNTLISDETFDDCLACKDEMQQSSELYNGYKIKEIYINRNYELFFKHTFNNTFYRVNSINLSWMPITLIYRLFHTYCRSLFSVLVIFNFKTTYIKFNNSNYSLFDKIVDKIIFIYLRHKS